MKKIITKIGGVLIILIGINIPINPIPFAIGGALLAQTIEETAYIKPDKFLLTIATLITLIIIGSYVPIGGILTGLITGFTITVTVRGLLKAPKRSTRKI